MSDIQGQIARIARQFGRVAELSVKGKVVAVQPDLFGGPDVEMRAWVRPIHVWHIMGQAIMPSEEEQRQHVLMHADTMEREP